MTHPPEKTPARVLVTGGAVRIGRAIAERFARGGAAVAVHCFRSVREAAALLATLPPPRAGAHRLVQADLRSPQACAELIPGLVAAGFTPDCLVNNASAYRRAPLAELTPERLQADFQLNFFAPFELMRAFANHCGRGVILNLLDQRVATVDPGAGSYGFAKKALRDATEAAALQWAPRIRVNGVAPGFVLPPPGVPPAAMAKFVAQIPLGRRSAEAEVAEACWFLAGAPTVTGQVLYVDGGLHLTALAVAEKADTWRREGAGDR
ncbi:MAG: SDR family oxidoreductase [Lentisphaeria bacterium]|jgi:NAD(P)-dependent dehydrogenase (short-subunit alcohol dehydrogenase family)